MLNQTICDCFIAALHSISTKNIALSIYILIFLNISFLAQGFYCLSGHSPPVPCPEGTFRSTERSPPQTCVACPVNFFNAKTGQVACFPCGSEATQPKAGQKDCVCLREGRVFQVLTSSLPHAQVCRESLPFGRN